MDAEEGLSDEEITLVARLLVDEERNKAEVFRKALEARPKSTKKAFDKKQVEFIDWATRKGYPSPEMVTDKDGSKTVGKSTVNQYIAALTALWKYQVLYNTNTNRTPRGVLVRAFNVA